MSNLTNFQRYRKIIDNWAHFKTACQQPLPTCIWANTLRIDPARLANLLSDEGIPVEPISWYPGAFKLPVDYKPGRHWAYLAGLYQVQEEIAMLPVRILDPRPGERILDLCAAPGNKTAQIAAALRNQGTVIANDINYSRMRATRNVLERLGLMNVTTTTEDGANYPATAGHFDKVLVDVPCSCEGTSRKDQSVLARAGSTFSDRKGGLQRALLRKAIQLCRPGGRVVYATCTYAPEENEAVVNEILTDVGLNRLRLLPTQFDRLVGSPGLTEWQGEQYHPALQETLRIWPHQNDTGGFYIAVLEKLDSSPSTLSSSRPYMAPIAWPEKQKDDHITLPALLQNAIDRFGLGPDCFKPYKFLQGKRKLYLVNRNHQPPLQPEPDAVGMLMMKTRHRFPKLSTAAALAFGTYVKRNYIDMDRSQIKAYLNRQTVRVTTAQSQHCTGFGYILARYQGYGLGVGLYIPGDHNRAGLVQSLFPKGWSPNN